MSRELVVRIEHWPIAGRFTIARGAKTEAVVVVAEIDDGKVSGFGECVPYARYGETVEDVAKAVEKMAARVSDGIETSDLQSVLPPGAARNALDCALWDLASKRSGRRIWDIAGIKAPTAAVTAYTLSVNEPDAMRAAAEAASARPLLKVKLGKAGDEERIRAVRAGAPDSELIVDANEGWSPENLNENIRACADVGVTLIEQPLPASADEALIGIDRPVTICADESVHTRDGLKDLRNRYNAVNIKLDKTGGLTEALEMARAAQDLGFEIMVGCMVGTSLAMAPALMLTPFARYVDLDGPLLLARDRPQGLVYDGSLVHPPARQLWG
ncbi:N-acetyl-D-Glu racemase DgcA [Flaviflagellibacter deserti]|uniref:Dipeptide epimerase n=1 Tax=Flaviflagellibacter deserti TaxID=2267266 RepID=A0ABV9Z345_9HYPH